MIYQFEILRNLTFVEKKTFRLHFLHSILEGVILGLLALNEYIFIRSMKGSEFLLSILFTTTVFVLIFSVFSHEFLKRYKNKRKLLIYTAFVTRLPLLLLIFYPADPGTIANNIWYHYIFLLIFFLFYSFQPVVLPLINLFLKANYSNENFGKLYGLSTMGNKIVMLVITFLFGLLLDFDLTAFRYIYPFMGILGIISFYILSKIRVDTSIIEFERKSLLQVIRDSFSNSWSVLKSNKAFLNFQIAFMLYGFSFMITNVLVTIFYDQVLHLNYSSTAFYKNFYNTVAILTLPYFGNLIGKMKIQRFASMTFIFMFFYILFTALSEYIDKGWVLFDIRIVLMLIIAGISYGLFASTMSLLWSIGSAYFCSPDEAASYQAVHLTLTGIRGCIAPFAGVFIYKNFGFTVAFIIAMLLLVAGIIQTQFTKSG
ncbi:MAG: MFS transporter [Sphingobacteriales bacterium]|nr:MFS transporter [Sphingobacteriales bacterium]